MRCVGPDLIPIALKRTDTLDGKLVVIGDPHDRPAMHVDLQHVFRNNRPGDGVLIECGPNHAYDGDHPVAGLRNIDDRDAVARQAREATRLLDTIRGALASLHAAGIPGGAGAGDWLKMAKVIDQARELQLPTYVLIEWAVDGLAKAFPDWKTAGPATPILERIVAADRKQAAVARECTEQRGECLRRALQEEAKRLRQGGGATTFAILALAHSEQARQQLAEADNVIWVEVDEKRLPARVREELKCPTSQQFRMTANEWRDDARAGE
jgi:hypothetical protein